MIPRFPNFKQIELSDKKDVEGFTHQYLPYSDFNFVSMWSWDVKGEMQISQLNNNLIVRFTDYLSGEPFFSFLGVHNVTETATELLLLSKKEHIAPRLELIPEDVVKDLQGMFSVEEDRNHFDYIFDVEKLANLPGTEYATKRSEVTRFLNKKPAITTKTIDISEVKIRTAILKLNYHWVENKKLKDPFFDIQNEIIAIDRFLHVESGEISCNVGIFLEDELVGYSINEIVNSEYAVGHFYKTTKQCAFEYLMKETNIHLARMGIKYLNFEQDLGMSGLRTSKLSYRPVKFLKKFSISFKE